MHTMVHSKGWQTGKAFYFRFCFVNFFGQQQVITDKSAANVSGSSKHFDQVM
jgi:hypothetical protein